MHLRSCLFRGGAALALMVALACAEGEPQVDEPVVADAEAGAGNAALAASEPLAPEAADDAKASNQAKLDAAIADALNGKEPASPAAPTPSASLPGETATTETLWVFEKRALARKAPDPTAAAAGILPWGKKLTVVASVQDFVRLDDGRYVRRQDLTDRKSRWYPKKGQPIVTGDAPMMSATIGGPAGAVKASGGTFVVTVARLHVRSMPSLGAPIVDKLSEGTRVAGKPAANGWIEIGAGRYLSAQFVVEAPTLSH